MGLIIEEANYYPGFAFVLIIYKYFEDILSKILIKYGQLNRTFQKNL